MDAALIDISVPLSPAMPVYPGDPAFAMVPAAELRADDAASVRLSRLQLGSHTGTHLDAPCHVLADGAGVAVFDLEQLCGPARVLDLRGRGPLLEAAALADQPLAGAGRLLLRTADGPPAAAAGARLAPSAAALLLDHGVRLVGIDALSIEDAGHSGLAVHRALLGAAPPVAVLESLDLSAAPAGDYRLWCLPLPLPAADGAPARAVLQPGAAPAAG